MSIKFLFCENKVVSLDSAISHLNDSGIWNAFDERAVTFINKFSSQLLKQPSINKFPDLVALAYWFRRSSLKKLKERYIDDLSIIRVGRGISLHIAPSNVDTIFVYSFFLSLLAGNTSFIRVSSNESPQLSIIIKVFQDLYNSGNTQVAGRFVICTYPHENEATEIVSKTCELRVVWGGDETVNAISSIPLNPTALELKFPNRSSFSIISLDSLSKIDDKDLHALCSNFYKDIELFGQQACSSPMAIFFIGSSRENDQSKRFWDFFYKVANHHDVTPSESMDRIVAASSMAISGIVNKASKLLTVKDIVLLNGDLSSESSFRNEHPGNGFLVQYFIPTLIDLSKYISTKDQTLSIFGFNKLEINDFIKSIANRGIDRIVPIGQALDFSSVWDGNDLIDSMCRKIDVSKLSG